MRAHKLYGATIFLSAFLLFLIQPLIGRHLLPVFGGASAVWATSLLFFTTALFLGYAYTYYVSRLHPRTQVRIHFFVLAVAVVLALAHPLWYGSIYPSLEWTLTSAFPPAAQVLLALAISIGIPYFLLATTGPLVQHWYGVMESKEPYHLYALSNIASFVALGTYPFVIEPMFTLSFQKSLWLGLFAIFVVLYGAITIFFLRSHVHVVIEKPAPTPFLEKLRWIGLASLPAALLVATTAEITQAVAPVPFLWVIPLALYLFTFVIAFRGWGNRGIIPALAILSAAVAFMFLGFSYDAITRQMLVYLAFFFFTSLFCHAELYASRPHRGSSSLFYLCTAFGGMIGTTLVSIVAPLVFVDVFEFPFGLALAAGVAITLFPAMRYVRDEFERSVMVLRIIALVVVLAASIHFFQGEDTYYSVVSRNFYGVAKISEDEERRNLYNGTTFHGEQLFDKKLAYIPTTYYTAPSGIGRAIRYEEVLNKKVPINVGTIGLGTGTIASYCRPGDRYTFYDIDPRIEMLARTYFTYLEHCAGSDVRIGDARLLLDKERREGKLGTYDILAVDAFSSDTIPAHLLTIEAMRLYLEHLKDDRSLLVVHTSNRYLTLAPVVRRIAQELGLTYRIVDSSSDDAPYATFSQWVIVSRDPHAFESPIFKDLEADTNETRAPLWTDDYMNIFAALKLPAIYNFSSN